MLFLLDLSRSCSGSSIRLYRKWACPKRWQRRRRRRFGPRRSMFSLRYSSSSSCCNNPRQIFALCGVTKRWKAAAEILVWFFADFRNVEQSAIFILIVWFEFFFIQEAQWRASVLARKFKLPFSKLENERTLVLFDVLMSKHVFTVTFLALSYVLVKSHYKHLF